MSSRDCPRPAFLRFASIQKRIRTGVKQFVAEGRWFPGIAGNEFDRALFDFEQNVFQTLDIKLLIQAIVKCLVDEDVIGSDDSGQPVSRGKTAVSKSSARKRCNGGGTFLPFCMRETSKARVTFQRQRTWNMG